MFQIIKTSTKSRARLTRLITRHGTIEGPFFMPIATRGAVKHLTPDEVRELGASVILANTYHLARQPGAALVAKAGGLNRLIGWPGPILTDSGGFQVFSLAPWRQVTDRGVRFRDPSTGAKIMLTPKRAITIQRQLGSDILMALDECVGSNASRAQVAQAVDRTSRWARATVRHLPRGRWRPLVFGIIQGGLSAALRQRSARTLVALPFDGYAIGGLALPGVHEASGPRLKIVRQATALLPPDKPRYLMGVGRPEEIVAAVRLGVDMFDCVIPTREARHGRLYAWSSPARALRAANFYRVLSVRNAGNRQRLAPPDPACLCLLCRRFTLAYLHHLFQVNEPLGARLATMHNLRFYLDLMARLQMNIRQGVL